jgi:hypothetical protein
LIADANRFLRHRRRVNQSVLTACAVYMSPMATLSKWRPG